MMTAAQRRRAVLPLTRRRISSQRRACRRAGLSRSVARYRLLGRDDSALRARRRALAAAYPRYGYPTLHDRLKRQGWVIHRTCTYRLYREAGLPVRAKRRKPRRRPRGPLRVPRAVNDRWSVDCMSDHG
jgi:putative transposase